MTPDLLCSRSSVGLGEETATRVEVEGTGTSAAPPPTHHSPNQTVCRARFGSNSGGFSLATKDLRVLSEVGT